MHCLCLDLFHALVYSAYLSSMHNCIYKKLSISHCLRTWVIAQWMGWIVVNPRSYILSWITQNFPTGANFPNKNSCLSRVKPQWECNVPVWATPTDWSSSFPFPLFLNIGDWCWKNLLQQIDFPSPFPLYFFSIPNNFSPIPNRKGRHHISLSI